MLRLPDGRIAVAINAQASRHEETWRASWESGYTNNEQYHMTWAIWDDGRIAGIEAAKAGEFSTLPLKATGRPIEVNVRTVGSGAGLDSTLRLWVYSTKP